MYQFTTTNVINAAKALDYDGNILLDGLGNEIPKFTGTAAGLNVVQVGNFKKSGIVGFHKRPYSAPVLEVAEVTVPVIAAGLVARLEVNIQLSDSANSDYVDYTTNFNKPIVVEILSSGVAATDATNFVKQLNALKNRFGHSHVTAAVNSSTKVRVTAKEAAQKIKSMLVFKEDTSQNTMIQPKYTDVTGGTFTVVTVGKVGFGDDNWMLRKITLPTAENVRHFGISKGERPIMGGKYTQFTLRYAIPKDGTDGTVSGATSVTTHVFYVLDSLVSAFETAIGNIGLGAFGLMAVTAAETSLANSATTQASATGAVGPVTWSITSGTSATVNATTGVITAHSVTDGVTVVKGTDAVGNSAEVSITVA
jgi:hypothetical protein